MRSPRVSYTTLIGAKISAAISWLELDGPPLSLTNCVGEIVASPHGKKWHRAEEPRCSNSVRLQSYLHRACSPVCMRARNPSGDALRGAAFARPVRSRPFTVASGLGSDGFVIGNTSRTYGQH
jgi:hypothetical protein